MSKFFESFQEWASKAGPDRSSSTQRLVQTWESGAKEVIKKSATISIQFETLTNPIYILPSQSLSFLPTWFEPLYDVNFRNLPYVKPIALSRKVTERILHICNSSGANLFQIEQSDDRLSGIPAHIRRITIIRNFQNEINLVVPWIPKEALPVSITKKIFGNNIFENKSFVNYLTD